jgi:hypothetical protein
MDDIMVLDITTETGRKLWIVNVYDQLEKGRNTNIRAARMANWNNIMTNQTIVCGDFDSQAKNGIPIAVANGMQRS